MKHQSVRFYELGAPADVLTFETDEKLTSTPLNAGEVRVKIQFSPINPADLNYIQGNYGIRPVLPAIPGVESSGVVIESSSDNVVVGNQVIFITRVGTWQSEVICAAEDVIVLPNIQPEQAAMLKVNPLTALCLLENYVPLNAGDFIIQNAANSGVGQCVIQIAKILGIRTINLVRRAEVIPELLELGADHVLLDDDSVVAKVHDICGVNLPKLACNAVGGDSALRLIDALAEQGQHITFGAMSMRSLKVPNKFLIFKRIQLHGLWVTKWIEENDRPTINAAYQRLATWVATGQLIQAIDTIYKPENIHQAITLSTEGKRRGKILLDFRSL
jgi:mitochondrial enoyl-[acyl-carrier protein] reductase / trans-2-enoyl-CoA reductase